MWPLKDVDLDAIRMNMHVLLVYRDPGMNWWKEDSVQATLYIANISKANITLAQIKMHQLYIMQGDKARVNNHDEHTSIHVIIMTRIMPIFIYLE